MNAALQNVLRGERLADAEALALADFSNTRALADVARATRPRIPQYGYLFAQGFYTLTHLCRDVCHYCTFAQVPRKVMAPYMSIEEVLEVAATGQPWAARKPYLP